MNSISTFDIARIAYRKHGTVKGLGTEFSNFKHRYKDWGKILPLLLPAIEKQIAWRKDAGGDFRPCWKNFQTWINQRCWEDEIPDTDKCLCCDSPATKKSIGKGLCGVCREYWYRVQTVGWGGFPANVIERYVERGKAQCPRQTPKPILTSEKAKGMIADLARDVFKVK